MNSKGGFVLMKKWISVCLMLMIAALLCGGALAEDGGKGAVGLNVGDVVTYGHYEQDNDAQNGMEPIEWVVLDVQDEQALLLTKYAIDSRYYHPGERETSYPTWAKSSIRAWLNSDFIDTAFTAEEQEAIVEVTLENASYKKNYGGADTTDRVFFLSRAEVEQYFPTQESRLCVPTAYALAQGAWESTKYTLDGVNCTWWWLRTPGYYRSCAASVRTVGTITSNRVYDESGAVRPAIWLDLTKAAY